MQKMGNTRIQVKKLNRNGKAAKMFFDSPVGREARAMEIRDFHQRISITPLTTFFAS